MANESGQQGEQGQQQQADPNTATGTNQGQKGAEGQQGAQGQQQQQQQAGSQFSYPEDRSKWIPPHRFKEVNDKVVTGTTQAQQLQNQLAQAQQKIAALAGVQQKAPEDLEVEEVRAHFAKLYPGLAKLTDAQIERLLDVAESADRIKETTNNYWQKHGRQMINNAGEAIADKLGGGDLNERQVRRVARDYIAFVEENEAIDRHEAGDPKLIEEFVKNFLEDWQEPIRRSVTSRETNQRPVPSGRGRNLPPQGRKKVDHNNPKAVEDAMVESFLNHGGQFGN